MPLFLWEACMTYEASLQSIIVMHAAQLGSMQAVQYCVINVRSQIPSCSILIIIISTCCESTCVHAILPNNSMFCSADH